MATEQTTSTPALAYWYVAIGLLSFSFSPNLVRLAGDEPALSLAFWRNALAVVLLIPFAWKRTIPELTVLSRRELARIGLAGLLLGVHFYLFFEAINLTTVASASVFVSVTPIFLAVLGWLFLRERLPAVVWLAIGMAVVGGVMIAFGDVSEHSTAPHPVLGNALALAACLFVSIYLLIGRVARRKLSWIAYVFPLYSVSALTLAALCLAAGAPIWGLNGRAYLMCLFMAIGPHIAGHGSFNYAVKYVPAAILGLLSLTEPIGSTILAYFFFHEFPGAISLFGMSVTLLAIGLVLGPELWKSELWKSRES